MSIQKKEDDEEALRSFLLVRIEPALEVNLKALTGAGASVCGRTMMLPKNIKTQHLARLDELIAEGKQVVDSIRVIPPHTRAAADGAR